MSIRPVELRLRQELVAKIKEGLDRKAGPYTRGVFLSLYAQAVRDIDTIHIDRLWELLYYARDIGIIDQEVARVLLGRLKMSSTIVDRWAK